MWKKNYKNIILRETEEKFFTSERNSVPGFEFVMLQDFKVDGYKKFYDWNVIQWIN